MASSKIEKIFSSLYKEIHDENVLKYLSLEVIEQKTNELNKLRKDIFIENKKLSKKEAFYLSFNKNCRQYLYDEVEDDLYQEKTFLLKEDSLYKLDLMIKDQKIKETSLETIKDISKNTKKVIIPYKLFSKQNTFDLKNIEKIVEEAKFHLYVITDFSKYNFSNHINEEIDLSNIFIGDYNMRMSLVSFFMTLPILKMQQNHIKKLYQNDEILKNSITSLNKEVFENMETSFKRFQESANYLFEEEHKEKLADLKLCYENAKPIIETTTSSISVGDGYGGSFEISGGSSSMVIKTKEEVEEDIQKEIDYFMQKKYDNKIDYKNFIKNFEELKNRKDFDTLNLSKFEKITESDFGLIIEKIEKLYSELLDIKNTSIIITDKENLDDSSMFLKYDFS